MSLKCHVQQIFSQKCPVFLHTGRNVCLFWKARGKFSLSSLKLSLFSSIFGSDNRKNAKRNFHFNPTINTMVKKNSNHVRVYNPAFIEDGRKRHIMLLSLGGGGGDVFLR
jgi:hypothetical protein